MYRGVIFDCDGVMVDSTTTSPDRFFSVARLRGLPVTPEILAQRDVIARIGGDAIKFFWPDENSEAFYREWERVDLGYDFKPISGVQEALETLRHSHYQLSVLSNRRDRTLIPLVERLGLAHLFFYIHGCASGPYLKPDRRSAELLLAVYENKLAISSKEIVFVGDSFEADWPVARDNGLEFVGVLTGVSSERDYLEAGVLSRNIIRSITELPGWFQENER